MKLASGWVEPFLPSESWLLPSPVVKGEGSLFSLTLCSSLPLKSAVWCGTREGLGLLLCAYCTPTLYLLVQAAFSIQRPPTCHDPWGDP